MGALVPWALVIAVLCGSGQGPASPPQEKAAPQRLETKPAEYIPDLMRWIAEHYDITKAYQRGETDAALRLLAQRAITEQRQIVERIMGVLETQRKAVETGGGSAGQADASQRRPGEPFTNPGQKARPATGGAYSQGLPKREDPPFTWTVDMMTVAGSLHMDAALQAYRLDDAASAEVVGDQIRIARGYFGYYALRTGHPDESRRWELAIGLTAMADGRFGQAATILDDACARFAEDAPLQLACGSIHETIAMLPADLLADIRTPLTSRPAEDNPLTEFDESTAPRSWSAVYGRAQAKSARAAHLKQAARAFEFALASNANDAERQLRLAHVRMLLGNDKAAERLLAPLVAEAPDAPPRIAYLSRLYLGEVRTRQRQAEAAATLFEEALALVPSGRSAYIALASLARAGGNWNQASAVLHSMLRAPTGPADPWIGYQFGQFWVPDRLIAQLRAEAQQQ